jgi:hypothetical protein
MGFHLQYILVVVSIQLAKVDHSPLPAHTESMNTHAIKIQGHQHLIQSEVSIAFTNNHSSTNHIGSVLLHLPKGKSIELRDGTHLSGPLHIVNQPSNWYLDPETFPEPERFVPERWLADDNSDDGSHPLKVTAPAKQASMPWGGRVHICRGMESSQSVP